MSIKKQLIFDLVPESSKARLTSLLERIIDHIGIQDGDTYAECDQKFLDALEQLDWTDLTKDMVFGAWLKATDHERPSESLDYTDVGMLIGALAAILGDWIPTKLPPGLFGGAQ